MEISTLPFNCGVAEKHRPAPRAAVIDKLSLNVAFNSPDTATAQQESQSLRAVESIDLNSGETPGNDSARKPSVHPV